MSGGPERGTAGTLRCPTCGRSWATDRARFCGVCGASLPGDASGRRTSRRRRVVGVLIASALASATLTVLVLHLDAPGVLRLADGEVALTAPAGDRSAGGLEDGADDRVAARLRSTVDPTAIRCQPRGCEVWRMPMHETGWTIAGVGPGAVAFVRSDPSGSTRSSSEDGTQATELLVLDAGTGQEALRARTDWLPSAPASHEDSSLFDPPLDVAANQELVFVFDGSMLRALDRNGGERWSRELPGVDVTFVGASEAYLHVVLRALGPSAVGGLVLLDADDGSIVREASGDPLVVTDHLAVLIRPQPGYTRWEAVDLTDGRMLWARRSEHELLPVNDQHLLLWTRGDGPDLLVDAGTGRVRAEIPGQLVASSPTPGGSTVALIDHGRPGAGPHPLHWLGDGTDEVTMVGFDADGHLVWRIGVPEERQGFVDLLLETEDVVTLVVDGHRTMAVDLASGRQVTVPTDELTDSLVPWTDRRNRLLGWHGHHVRLEEGGGYVVVTGRDTTHLIGEGSLPAWGHDDPVPHETLVFTDGYGVIGVRLVPTG